MKKPERPLLRVSATFYPHPFFWGGVYSACVADKNLNQMLIQTLDPRRSQ